MFLKIGEYTVITLKILDLELTHLGSQDDFTICIFLLLLLLFCFVFSSLSLKVMSQIYPKETWVGIIKFAKLERVGAELCIILVGLPLEDVYYRIYLVVILSY